MEKKKYVSWAWRTEGKIQKPANNEVLKSGEILITCFVSLIDTE